MFLSPVSPPLSPSPPSASISRQGPCRSGRAGHGGPKLPAPGLQFAEDSLDEGRFAAEEMNDVGDIQQHALGENVGSIPTRGVNCLHRAATD